MKTTASSSLMLLGLAHSKFHFIRKGSVVERSTIRAFFLRHAADCIFSTVEHSRAAVQGSQQSQFGSP
ncbi:hypothetical protein, partial [Sutterella wadsworthensis]|uniref:hypothetical protein n=1 Tax=Sutterella wadsworthensis TaxID=40545 RepID=UPI003AF67155